MCIHFEKVVLFCGIKNSGKGIMIFSFLCFTLFLMMVLSVYFIVPVKLRYGWLLLASYVFCLTYGRQSFYILLCSTVVSYLFGLLLDKVKCLYPERKKTLVCLWCGIIFCVIPLLFGKIKQSSLFVSIGTSFYLLQQIGYLTDIYKGKSQAERNLIHYALFVAFFPKLVSGPIERSGNFLKQINDVHLKTFCYEEARSGFQLMLWGYFQKVIIADSLAVYVTNVYDHWEGYAGGTIGLASIVYAFQLYADFEGYTNIALGAAQTLGIHLRGNFKQPYLSDSIREFWKRWHISFSSWLKDYIYIPLGGSKKGTIRHYTNLIITFLISGLWHGSGLNFVAWGMLHGAFQVAENICLKFREKLKVKALENKSVWKNLIKRIAVFILVDFAWIFFRASGLKTAMKMVYKICFDFSISKIGGDLAFSLHLTVIQILMGALGIALLLAVDLMHEKNVSVRRMVDEKPIIVRWICYLSIVLILSLAGMARWGGEASNFIYMQF